MTDAELRKLKRSELLEILLEQAKEIERLEEENASLLKQLENKRILIRNAGTMAEAAFALNGVFEAADAAVRQYLDNIYAGALESQSGEAQTEEKAEKTENTGDAENAQEAEDERQPVEEQNIPEEQTGMIEV